MKPRVVLLGNRTDQTEGTLLEAVQYFALVRYCVQYSVTSKLRKLVIDHTQRNARLLACSFLQQLAGYCWPSAGA